MRDERRRGWWTVPRRWAGAFTVVAVLLAVIPGLAGGGDYNPDLAVLTATLVALVWYTCFTYEVLTRPDQEKGEFRAALATALLGELKLVEGFLRQAAAGGTRSAIPGSPAPSRPLLNRALRELSLFHGDTARCMVRFESYVEWLEGLIAIGANLSGPERLVVANRVRAQAFHAIEFAHELVRLLATTEGGEMPPAVPDPVVTAGDLPDLPRSPFGEFDLEGGFWGDDQS